MSEIEFETDLQETSMGSVRQQYRDSMQNKYGGTITKWFIKTGFIRDESRAKAVLLGIVICNFVLAALLLYIFVI